MRCFVAWLQVSDWHPLVRTALLHLNLVAIHPWMNGNGRTARILSSLELMRHVRAPELISIEPAILRRHEEYFRLIREALGPTYPRIATRPQSGSRGTSTSTLIDLRAVNVIGTP